MFNLFKKEVTAKECGHQMWQLCVDFTEQFCLRIRPELQAAGYVKNPIEDRKFMEETLHLHIWIIFCALGNKTENDMILEVFNDCAMPFISEQQRKQVSIQERCKNYYQAYSKHIEALQNGGVSIDMAKTALPCLVVNYKVGLPRKNGHRNCVNH